jgi:mannose-6-phosphate isomerase
MRPWLLEPSLSPRLWGSGILPSRLGLEPPPNADPVGEAWLLYDQNRVMGAPAVTLAELLSREPSLLGEASLRRYGEKLPLLSKLIDAAERLSIQVHPDDAYARSAEAATGHFGKAEAWLILEAEPGASIVWGFAREVDKAELRSRVERGTLEEVLNVVPVSPGDVIYNPPGTVHAIGAGILLFEIQQASDLTYRLYDYGRRDAQGRTRELHVDKALEVVDLRPGERAKVVPVALTANGERLVACEHFAMERWRVTGRQAFAVDPARFETLTVVEGALTLAWEAGELALGWGATVFVPATLSGYTLEGEGAAVRCYP